MPFLTIITRSFRRPRALLRCVQSVAGQSDPDVEHLIVHDPIGRGVAESYRRLAELRPSGEYVFLLDDDDYLIDPLFVEKLKAAAGPEVVFCRMDLIGRVVPPSFGAPVLGQIAVSCFAVRRSVWEEHAADFASAYEGDYRFIRAVWDCPNHHPFTFLDAIVARIGGVHNGYPEDSDPAAVGLSAAAAGALFEPAAR